MATLAVKTFALSPRRHPVASQHRDDHSTFIVAAFFVAVVIAVAIAVAIAVSKIPDVGALYITVT
jgi:hypothetical protein